MPPPSAPPSRDLPEHPPSSARWIGVQDVGCPLVVCTADGVLLAASPSAEGLLMQTGAPCGTLPCALPASLWNAVTGAPLGQSIDWRPPQASDRCIGLTRYRLGDAQYVLLMREITDAQAELRRRLQRQRLEAIGQLIAGIVHDLRAPLSSILFGASVLADHCNELSIDQVRERLEQIKNAAARQQETIAGLLDFARIGPPLKLELPVESTFKRVAALLRPSLREGNHLLRIGIEAGAETVYGNPIVVEQILVNLIMNAAESATRPVHIELRAKPSATRDAVELHVVDDGPGVPEELRTRVFEPFFTTKANGTGLGLVLASEAAADQGGSLRLAPSPAGAHFIVTLPRETTGNTREFPTPDDLPPQRFS